MKMGEVYFQKEYRYRKRPETQRKPGKKIRIKTEFAREGKLWKIPAVYLFEEGVVMDLCCRIDPGSVREYYGERKRLSEKGWKDPESFAFLEARNPWPRSRCINLNVNGQTLLPEGSTGGAWIPEDRDGEMETADMFQDPEIRKILDDYRCDREHAWYFMRSCFRWAAGEKQEMPKTIRTMTAEIAEEPRTIPGFCFVTRDGEKVRRIPFFCPLSGEKGVLIIQERFSRKLEEDFFEGTFRSGRKAEDGCRGAKVDVEYPLYQNVISWSTEPEWLRSVCTITDCSAGDRPRKKKAGEDTAGSGIQTSEEIGSCAMSVFYLGDDRKTKSWSSSSLTFEKKKETNWQVDFTFEKKDSLLVECFKE